MDKKIVLAKFGKISDFFSLVDETNAVSCFSNSVCRAVCEGHPTQISALASDKDSRVLAVGCVGGSLWLWDAETGKHVSTLPGHRSEITCIEFHPFGAFFASGGNDTNVKVWDHRRCVQTYRSHSAPIVCVQFSPHGRWLASGDQDGVLNLWDLTSGKLLCTTLLSTCECIAFHPKDFFLVAGSQIGLTVWSCEDPTNLAPVASSTCDGLNVKKVAFTADGTGIVALTNSSVLLHYLWDGKNRSLKHEETVELKNKLVDLTTADDSGWKVLVSDENNYVRIVAQPSQTESPPFQTESKMSETILPILSRRLMSARTICGLWSNGNPKAAISEAITLSKEGVDRSVFTSLMAAVPNTKCALTVDTCVNILREIQAVIFEKKNFVADSFVLSSCLNAIVFLSKRFDSILRDIQKTPLTPSGDFSRDERVARGRACIALFHELEHQIHNCSDIPKREKQDTLQNIVLIKL